MSYPFILITLGPTGSGKTMLVKEALQYVYGGNVNQIPYQKFLIDDLVENDQVYKEMIDNILSNYIDRNRCRSHDEKCVEYIETILDHLSEETLDKFQKAYYDVRTKQGCGKKGDVEKESCDEKLDRQLTKALVDGTNIIFETTGSSYPGWLIDKINDACKHNKHKYNMIVAVSNVELENLIKRNKSRAVMSTTQFFTKENQPAPRLPKLSELSRRVEQIHRTVHEMIEKCVKNHCTDRFRLLQFDNNGHKMILIEDLYYKNNKNKSYQFKPKTRKSKTKPKRKSYKSYKSKNKSRKSKPKRKSKRNVK